MIVDVLREQARSYSEKLKDTAFIQDSRMIVDVLREQARSYSEKLKDTAFIRDARVIEDVAAFVTAWTGL